VPIMPGLRRKKSAMRRKGFIPPAYRIRDRRATGATREALTPKALNTPICRKLSDLRRLGSSIFYRNHRDLQGFQGLCCKFCCNLGRGIRIERYSASVMFFLGKYCCDRHH